MTLNIVSTLPNEKRRLPKKTSDISLNRNGSVGRVSGKNLKERVWRKIPASEYISSGCGPSVPVLTRVLIKVHV